MKTTIKFQVVTSAGKSTLSMRKVLETVSFDSQNDAENYAMRNGFLRSDFIDSNKVYSAVVKQENGCVYSCCGFYQ